MGNSKSKIALVLAIAITAMFIVQATFPLLSAAQNVIEGSKDKAKPWPYVIPKEFELPLLSSLPKSKVDPRIYKQIDSGASSVQVIILYDWHFRDKLLASLPAGSKLLRYATEVIQYLPLLGVSLPANKNEIQRLASLPYVKLIAYNEPLSYEMLNVMNPKIEAELFKKEFKTQQALPSRWYATPLDVAIETRATELWKKGITGKGVIIGIMDTGINPRHPDFFFPDGRSKIIFSFSPFSGEDAYTTIPTLFAGHGTHVASIAAASGLGSGQGWYLDRATFLYQRATISKGEITGLAPDAYLAIFKIFSDPNLSAEPPTVYHIAISIVQAVKVGVDVMNASWGFIGFDADTQAVLYYAVAWAIQCGMVWVNSAGNYGPGFVTLGFPAAQESVITVGLTYPANFPSPGYGKKVVYWSSRGPTYPANSFFQNGADIIPTTGFLSAGRNKPDILAPGFGIMAANAGFEFPSPYESLDPFNDTQIAYLHAGVKYKALSGTSMAAPVITGIVALLIQAFPGATPAAIKAALINGAVPTTTVQGVSDPNISGAGLVDALNAYNILAQSPKKSGFKIPPPYWVVETQATPDAYKQIFRGYKILVDDITAVGESQSLGLQYSYNNFIDDLRNRGANITYLSQAFPPNYVWQQINQTIESPHPYEPLTNQFYHIYYPGATAIQIHFARIGLGISPTLPATTSYIVVYSWDWSTIVALIVGPTDLYDVLYPALGTPGVHIRLITDNSTGYGFKVDWYAVQLPKPSIVDYNVRREVLLQYYWSNRSTNPWEVNVAPIPTPITVGKATAAGYSDLGNEPWIKKEYLAYQITYEKLLEWYKVKESISQCYWPYLARGNFSLYDLWLPLPSFGLNYTAAFDPNNPPPLGTMIEDNKAGQGIADIMYVNATVYDMQTKSYTTMYLTLEIYRPYYRNGMPATVSSLDDLVRKTVPQLLFGGSALYSVSYLTGVESWKWVRLTTNDPNKRIFVDASHPIKIWFITNGDGKGGIGLEANYLALGSASLTPEDEEPEDPSIFNTVILSGHTNRPNAIFYGQFDLFLILTPWYVDPEWVDRIELKNYVDNYIGRVLFVGGYIPRMEPFFGTYFDEPVYMLPRGSEVGTPVKMNYYTWDFGVEWVSDSIGGPAKILVPNNPIFAPGVAPDGSPLDPVVYLGSEVMSIKLRPNAANTKIWALDPTFPAIAFYNSTPCNGVLMISDSYVLSDISYGSEAFLFHQWFGLRAVAYLLDSLPPYNLVAKVNQWFYPIGGAEGGIGLFVRLQYNKIVANGTIWTLNYTITNYLPYAVSIHAKLEIPSNSTIAGLIKAAGLNLTDWRVVVPPATDQGPSIKTFAIGGIAYTKFLATTSPGIGYYPAYTELWSTFKFNATLYANFTDTGAIDYDNPIFSHAGRSVSILNKIHRQGDLPLVSTATPLSFDSYTSNLVAKYPLDWKYVNITIINPDVSISSLKARITGNVSSVAQFATLVNETFGPGVWRVKLVLLGPSVDLRPENVSAIAGQALESYQIPVPVPIDGPLFVPIADGHYPGLPHTGHYYAFVFVFIDPNLPSGMYTGDVNVLDDNNNVIARTKLAITVEQRPNGYIVWDDGLYINNRPAVDDPANYHGVGYAVFTAHDWPTQPWVNAFELWRTISGPELNFAVKPSGAISIALDIIAENQTPGQPLWKIEAFYRDLVNRVFKDAQGFMLVENAHFRPFDGYYFAREIGYAPEIRWVNYTARDIMIKILAENKGSLIVFSQFASANSVNPVSGQPNPYNMNWLLGYVGSRVYFPTGINTSAAKDLMLFATGLPSFDLPIPAGWRTITPPALPYNTISFYYLFASESGGYGLISDIAYNETKRKLFLDVNSFNLVDGSITYSKYVLPTVIETPMPYPPLTTFVYKITVPNADYVLPVFDYIKVSVGTIIQILDTNYEVKAQFIAASDVEDYGVIIGGPVRGDTVYIKFTSSAAVKPGFDAGIRVSYVLYASTAYFVKDIAQFYVKNEDDPELTWQDGRYRMADWNAIAGKWGIALALDTRLTGISGEISKIPLPDAKVIAFGQSSFFENVYFQHFVTHITGLISESAWRTYLKIFLRSILQYVGGYYTAVTGGITGLETFISFLRILEGNARDAGMIVSPEVDTKISAAEGYIAEAKNIVLTGNYIAAASPLLKANSTLSEAATLLVTQLEEQANSEKLNAMSTINKVRAFVNLTASYNVDVREALTIWGNAEKAFDSGNSTLALFNREDPATWFNLVDSYKAFKQAGSLAILASQKAVVSAYNLATMIRDQATKVLNTVYTQVSNLAAAGIPASDSTRSSYELASVKLASGDNSMKNYNIADINTYTNVLDALASYREALGFAEEALSSVLNDARNAAAEKLAELRSEIAKTRALPHDESIVAAIDAKVPFYESRLVAAKTVSDFIRLYSEITDDISRVRAAVITPTTPAPGMTPLQLAIIVILILILIFALVYAATRRRRAASLATLF